MATDVTVTAADQWSADVLEVTDAQGVVTLAGADPARRALTIYTDPDSVGTLYLVPNAGQARSGIRIVPGAGFTFAHGAPVYGRAVGGLVTVSVVAETGSTC